MASGISRWWRVVGGLSMNLALGTLYAWSVFVAPLEEQFGWKRADTSMVFTIAVVVFALTFVLAGRIHYQPDLPVCLLRCDRRLGQWFRLRHADTGHGQVVPR
jgi:hypothetical protein